MFKKKKKEFKIGSLDLGPYEEDALALMKLLCRGHGGVIIKREFPAEQPNILATNLNNEIQYLNEAIDFLILWGFVQL